MDHRGFLCVEDMNQYMIQKWNKRVRKNDEVVVLGDFSFGKAEETNKILESLHGRIFLIRGNHDKFLNKPGFNISRFEWVKDYAEMNDDGRKVILCHYPIVCYNGQFRRDKNGNPNIVDPSNYKVGNLSLTIGSTFISTLGNLPKCNGLIINASNSALVTLDLIGHKNIYLGSFKNSKNLRSIKIDKDAELDGIKDYNFYGCSINQPLIFPKNMNLEYSDNEYEKMTIGYRAFQGENNTFTDVYFYGDESNYKISESAFNPGVRLHYNYEG